jgi:DNA-directed RNA polymerase specialized sigma24 family protein
VTKPASLDTEQSRSSELRFLSGLSIEETAAVNGISLATVKHEPATTRAWLRREMSKDAAK